jgi:hypothetical protein
MRHQSSAGAGLKVLCWASCWGGGVSPSATFRLPLREASLREASLSYLRKPCSPSPVQHLQLAIGVRHGRERRREHGSRGRRRRLRHRLWLRWCRPPRGRHSRTGGQGLDCQLPVSGGAAAVQRRQQLQQPAVVCGRQRQRTGWRRRRQPAGIAACSTSTHSSHPACGQIAPGNLQPPGEDLAALAYPPSSCKPCLLCRHLAPSTCCPLPLAERANAVAPNPPQSFPATHRYCLHLHRFLPAPSMAPTRKPL